MNGRRTQCHQIGERRKAVQFAKVGLERLVFGRIGQLFVAATATTASRRRLFEFVAAHHVVRRQWFQQELIQQRHDQGDQECSRRLGDGTRYGGGGSGGNSLQRQALQRNELFKKRPKTFK